LNVSGKNANAQGVKNDSGNDGNEAVLKPLVKTYVETQIIEFSLGKDLFAIDIQHVREIVEYKRIRPLPNTRAHIRGIIDLRGEITTIIDLALFLARNPTCLMKKNESLSLIPVI
jgi:purine-binding chemotaxis protein CheW